MKNNQKNPKIINTQKNVRNLSKTINAIGSSIEKFFQNASVKIEEANNSKKTTDEKALSIAILNAMFATKEGRKMNHVADRDEAIDSCFGIIGKRKNHNVIISGYEGTGRESIVLGIVEKIVLEKCPENFKGYTVIEVDSKEFSVKLIQEEIIATRIVVLAQFLNQTPCILYIKNIERLFEEGIAEYFDEIFDNNIVIGVTEIEDNDQDEESKQAAFESFGFVVYYVENPEEYKMYNALKYKIKLIEDFHKVKITEQNFKDIVDITRSIDIMVTMKGILDTADEACSIAKNHGMHHLDIKCINETNRSNIETYLKTDVSYLDLFARHEVGHCIVSLHYGIGIDSITIIPLGDSGGYNLFSKDLVTYTQEQFNHQLEVLLGGYCAEKEIGKRTVGPTQDVEDASNIVRQMYLQTGLGEEEGPISYTYKGKVVTAYLSEEMKRKLDDNVKRTLRERERSASEIIRKDKERFELITKALKKKGFLNKQEILELYNGKKTLEDIPELKDQIF